MHAVIDANNLYQAYKDVKKVSKWKYSTQSFEYNFLQQITDLQEQLSNDSYKITPKSSFIISERGKSRLIKNATVKDKVVSRVFSEQILIPNLTKKMIHDNGASLKGKGLSFTIRRLKQHLADYYRQYQTNDGWVLLMDYSGFYDNIQHDKLLKEVKPHIDDFSYRLLQKFVESYRPDVSTLSDNDIDALYHGRYKALDYYNQPKLRTKFLNKSLDIGDHCSQILGTFFPTKIDNFVKITKQQKYYGRYMDDSYIINPCKNELINILYKLKELASRIGLILNDNKIRIIKLSKFKFCNRKFYLSTTGRIKVKITSKLYHSFVRKLKSLKPRIKINHLFNSWFYCFKKNLSTLQFNNIITSL